MKAFNDSTGARWEISITALSVRRVRVALNVDLLTILGGELSQKIQHDPVLLVDVLWAICQTDAEQRKISVEQFVDRFFGDALSDATAALLDAVIEFFPKAKREPMARLMVKARTAEHLAVEELDKQIDALDVSDIVRREISRRLAEQPPVEQPISAEVAGAAIHVPETQGG